MTLRARFAAEGLWFDLLGPHWLNLTRAWRADPRIRQQFHTDRELSYDEHMAWYETRYLPDVDGQVVWVFGDEASGTVGHVSLYGANRETGTITFGRFYVGRSDLVGRGYGRRALRAVVDRAFALGFTRVVLDVKAGNERARRLYEQNGFETLGTAPGTDIVHMASVAPGAISHSIVVGSYNRPKYVAQTLRSILTQTRPNWQCIVSDDASNEETLAVIRGFTDVDPRFRLIIASDRLPPGARVNGNVRAVQRINDALALATGEVIHYIPDDDFFVPERLRHFDSIFADSSKIMGYGRLRYMLEDEDAERELFPGGPVMDVFCALDQSQVAHRRCVFEKVPVWPTDPNEIGYVADGVFYRQLIAAGYGPVWPVDALVTYKRIHPFNLQGTQAASNERREP